MNHSHLHRLARRHGEHGVALLFSLGILAVILVIVTIFASRTKTDSKISAAYAGTTATKAIAQSALTRAVLDLQQYSADTPFIFTGKQDSSDADYAGTGNADQLWKIAKYDSRNSRWEIEGQPVSTNFNDLRWNYIRNSHDNNKVVGRYAYVVIGGDRLSLNAFVPSGSSTNYGRSLAGCKFPDVNLDDSASPKKLTAENIGGTIYNDVEDVIRKLGVSKDKVSEARLRILEKFFVSKSPSHYDREAFYGKLGATGKEDSQYFHRFNLGRTDWNTVTVDNILGDAKRYYTQENGTTIISSDTDGGIPWLKNWNNACGMDSEAAAQKQIIANLINYNAPAERPPVSDKEGLWTPDNVPSYTGLKRTPYLNEIYLDVSMYATLNSQKNWLSQRWKNKLTYHLKVALHARTVKMFKDVWCPQNSKYKLTLFGEIGFQYTYYYALGELSTNKTAETFRNLSAESMFYNQIGTDSGYQEFALSKAANDTSDIFGGDEGITYDGGAYFSDEKQETPGDHAKVSNVSIKITGARLTLIHNGNETNVDYANISYVLIKENDTPLNHDSTQFAQVNLRAKDPRHNLRNEDWTKVENTAAHSLGEANPDLGITDSGNDPEAVENPAWLGDEANRHISTAYIRHAPMESLWELGAIHRAAPWQTLNLKKSPATTGDTDVIATGGGAYADGDGAILDQVKLTSDTTAMGKVNLNALSPDYRNFAFTSLFRGMPFSKKGFYDGNYEAQLTDEQATACVGWLNSLGSPLYRRSDIFNFASDNDRSFKNFFAAGTTITSDAEVALNTDALQEQLIGRVISLTKTETNYDSAVIVVLAQSIKDVSGAIYKDWNETGSVTDAANGTTGKRNAGYRSYSDNDSPFGTWSAPAGTINATIGTYDNGADLITGEVKLVARALYDKNTKKWKITKVYYEE